MESLSLKEYIARAKELEVAIFTAKKLMAEHERILHARRPKAPERKALYAPNENSRPKLPQNSLPNKWLRIAIIVSVFFFCLHLYVISVGWWTSESTPYILLVISLVLFVLAYFEHRRNQLTYAEILKQYEAKLSLYNKAVERYTEEKQQEEKIYLLAMKEHKMQMGDCIQAEKQTMIQHSNAIQELEKALDMHYNMGILFSKYRNLVAVATIDEYLQSGRCDTLEGSNGAYNLYEMELRQNIIIGQLTMVLDNIEQIRNNQYTLYQELTHANTMISELVTELKEMKSLEKLNTYFAAVSAKAAISPTYIHGHIH